MPTKKPHVRFDDHFMTASSTSLDIEPKQLKPKFMGPSAIFAFCSKICNAVCDIHFLGVLAPRFPKVFRFCAITFYTRASPLLKYLTKWKLQCIFLFSCFEIRCRQCLQKCPIYQFSPLLASFSLG